MMQDLRSKSSFPQLAKHCREVTAKYTRGIIFHEALITDVTTYRHSASSVAKKNQAGRNLLWREPETKNIRNAAMHIGQTHETGKQGLLFIGKRSR